MSRSSGHCSMCWTVMGQDIFLLWFSVDARRPNHHGAPQPCFAVLPASRPLTVQGWRLGQSTHRHAPVVEPVRLLSRARRPSRIDVAIEFIVVAPRAKEAAVSL